MQDAFSGILDLARDAADPLHVQIAEQIKAAIVAGRLSAHARIPSSRALSAELGVSRNTVIAAIEQLKAEGILETHQGSGVMVADGLLPDLERAVPSRPATKVKHRLAPRWQEPLEDFHPTPMDQPKPFDPGIPDIRAFPKDLWGACLRRAALRVCTASAGYSMMSGHPRFLSVLARHLAETRGVVAEPEQIIVTSSARGGISLIVNALLSEGEDCWVEEPGFRSAKAIFNAAGGKLVPVPVDAQGMDPARAPPASQPRLIYTTASHQFPTGALMSLTRRLALIERASSGGGYIIEDDYDSEFQYRGRPIAALQGLDDAECVLYLGTFAKSLVPGLRTGFVVAPSGLAGRLTKVHRHSGQLVPPVIQLALADFIERGHYRAHVRRMKAVYAHRLAVFAEGIAKHSRGALEALMPDGGLQTVIRSRDGISDAALMQRLRSAGIGGQRLSDFHIEPANATHRGILMGFAAWDESETAKAFERLAALYR